VDTVLTEDDFRGIETGICEVSLPWSPSTNHYHALLSLRRVAALALRPCGNKFRKLGFIHYNGGLQVHSSLLNVVLHD
jgi:hypothetical protein